MILAKLAKNIINSKIRDFYIPYFRHQWMKPFEFLVDGKNDLNHAQIKIEKYLFSAFHFIFKTLSWGQTTLLTFKCIITKMAIFHKISKGAKLFSLLKANALAILLSLNLIWRYIHNTYVRCFVEIQTGRPGRLFFGT